MSQSPLRLVLGASAEAQTVVNKIKERGYVSCGASQGVPGLSRPDEKGYYRGFNSDICRAFAVALLGDKDKIRFVPLNAGQRFSALQTGEIDILSRTSTLTYTRDMVVRFVWLTPLRCRRASGSKGRQHHGSQATGWQDGVPARWR